jgi:hypothetical protein
VLDGTDEDLIPGDKIQQYPAHVRECDPGFEATMGSKPDIVAAILALPPGSNAVIANHNETAPDALGGGHLNDLFVAPDVRGSGAGRALCGRRSGP